MTKTYCNQTKMNEILDDLLMGHVLSGLDAVDRYNTTRLAAFIHTIKKKYNIPVESIWRKSCFPDGEVTRYVEYRIPPSQLKESQKRHLR